MREIVALGASYDPPPERRFGLVQLSSDTVSSDEIRAVVAGPGRAVLETRIRNDDAISLESLAAMADGITEAADRLPGGDYDGIAYLCTSASMVIGFAGVADRVRASRAGVTVTNPLAAAIRAVQALGVGRIGLVTPYVAEVTERIADRFEADGVRVMRVGSFFQPSDARVARIDRRSLAEAAAAVSPGAEAVFLSCTALRTVGLLSALEAQLGLAVLSSNQAVAWDLLRAAALPPAPGDWGRLFAPAPALSR